MDKCFYKIKEFCRLSNLSRRALLLYENMNILVPEKIDKETGYRYYSEEQLYTASIIALLKNLDIPLLKIEEIINKKITLQQHLANSRTRLSLMDRQIKINNAIKTLSLIENDTLFLMPDVMPKVMPSCNVLTYEAWGKKRELPLYTNFMFRFALNHQIPAAGPLFIYYFYDTTETDFHCKVCYPVKEYWNISHNEIAWETFPQMNTLAMRCFGSYDLLPKYYQRLNLLLEERQVKKSGEFTETYIISGDPQYTDSSSFITDIAAVIL